MKKQYESPAVEVAELETVVMQATSAVLPISEETTENVDTRQLLFGVVDE
jgi:hypothetical protein